MFGLIHLAVLHNGYMYNVCVCHTWSYLHPNYIVEVFYVSVQFV